MDTNNLNQQNGESGSLTPPPEEELNIRTMGSDRQTARQTPEIIRPLEPEIPFASSTPEPELASILEETIPTDETPKAIPDWAQEKIIEEETTTEPLARKAITFTIIIVAIIIGFVLIGYFVASKFIFKH